MSGSPAGSSLPGQTFAQAAYAGPRRDALSPASGECVRNLPVRVLRQAWAGLGRVKPRVPAWPLTAGNNTVSAAPPTRPDKSTFCKDHSSFKIRLNYQQLTSSSRVSKGRYDLRANKHSGISISGPVVRFTECVPNVTRRRSNRSSRFLSGVRPTSQLTSSIVGSVPLVVDAFFNEWFSVVGVAGGWTPFNRLRWIEKGKHKD